MSRGTRGASHYYVGLGGELAMQKIAEDDRGGWVNVDVAARRDVQRLCRHYPRNCGQFVP